MKGLPRMIWRIFQGWSLRPFRDALEDLPNIICRISWGRFGVFCRDNLDGLSKNFGKSSGYEINDLPQRILWIFYRQSGDPWEDLDCSLWTNWKIFQEQSGELPGTVWLIFQKLIRRTSREDLVDLSELILTIERRPGGSSWDYLENFLRWSGWYSRDTEDHWNTIKGDFLKLIYKIF